MFVETQKFELIEVYMESKDTKILKETMKEYRENGYAVSGPNTHYGEYGNESDKMYWVKATKKIPIL